MLGNYGYRHTFNAIIIVFPRRQWLREHASMLRYTYNSSLVNVINVTLTLFIPCIVPKILFYKSNMCTYNVQKKTNSCLFLHVSAALRHLQWVHKPNVKNQLSKIQYNTIIIIHIIEQWFLQLNHCCCVCYICVCSFHKRGFCACLKVPWVRKSLQSCWFNAEESKVTNSRICK